MSPSTVRQVHSVISGALSTAVRWDWIPSNPASLAKKPRQPKPPTPEQAARIVAAAWEQDDDWGMLVWLVMVTGVRRGELVALRWHDVHLDGRILEVRRSYTQRNGEGTEKDTKTHQMRRIAIRRHDRRPVGRAPGPLRREPCAGGQPLGVTTRGAARRPGSAAVGCGVRADEASNRPTSRWVHTSSRATPIEAVTRTPRRSSLTSPAARLPGNTHPCGYLAPTRVRHRPRPGPCRPLDGLVGRPLHG